MFCVCWVTLFTWYQLHGWWHIVWCIDISSDYRFLRRPRGDIRRKKNNGNIPYVRDNDPVRTQSLSRTYAIMIPYVRNHYLVRMQCIPYVRNHYPVRTQPWSCTYAIIIPYVRNHYPVRTQSLSRTYAIMISYVRNHYPVRTQSWSCTYAIIIPYVRNHFPVCIRYDKIRPGDPTFCAPPPPPSLQTNPLTPAGVIVQITPLQVTPGGNLELVSSYPL